MQVTVVRNDTLAMSLSDAIAVYVVRRHFNGTQSVLRVLQDHEPDTKTAVKQIAVRAAEDANQGATTATDGDSARMG